MPRIISCTPDSNNTAANSEAQPGGGDENSASVTAIAPPIAPSTLRTKPVSVLRRSGMTEKLTNMLIQSRSSRRSV